MAGNTVKEMTTNFGKLDKFEGHDFRRWQKKMHFLLTTLKVVYVLTTPMLELLEDATVEAIRIRAKWENDDYICRGHILNGMSDSLFDVYTNVESAKELWDSLESKYMAEDSSSKKFLYNELLRILGQYTQHGLKMDESISVSSIIDKLPPSWKDFKHTLKHGKDDLSLVQLGSHLRIEESLRAHDSDKGKGKECGVPNKKPKLECWKCGKTGHFKRDCRSGKKNNANAGGSGKGSKDQSQDQGFGYYNNGIIHETTAPYTPQQNGVAERKNRALKEMVNSMLSYSGLSEGFWGEAMAVVRLTDPKRKTLGEKGIDCIFVGYAEHSKAYRFYVIEPNDSVSINSIIESRDAIFDENRFSSIPRPKDIIPNLEESQRDDHSDDVPSETPEPRRGKRAKKAKSYGSDFQLYLVEGSRDQVGSQYSYCYSIEEDPRTYNEAVQSRDAAFWKEAIDDEIGSIMENNTWVLSDLPPGCKPLGCKWIFKRKMKVDGTIDKFKARLVIQGFRQKEGIDYFDTYAPVARITTIRLLLALAAIHNLVIHQMDVKTAFLNGDLDEMCIMKERKDLLCLWHQKFDEVVLSSGFHLNQSDKCVYSKFDKSGKGVIICLYVDDMLIFGTDQNQVDKTKKFLSSRFSMKDMGEADIILGIKIKRENKGIVITQSHYIEKILKKFNREDCSPVSTPMDPVEKLKPNTGKPVDQLEYSRAIGCLMYAMTSTRPDIAYVVGRLSRFTSNPSRQHWKAITRVFKYLRGTKDYGLSYVGYPSVLEGYSDASWINHVEDSSSTSGWVFLLGGGAISWASKKQTCITSSTMESEFVALAAAGKEAEWLRNLIHEIPIWPKPIAPISIRCDSAPTMARAYSQIYNGKSRHLGVRHSMVRELIRNGVISIEFVRTQHNLADHLTKGLARDLLEIGTQVSSSRGARSKGTTYVNMKFSRFKKLGLSFLYVHQWIGTHGLLLSVKLNEL
ncbi:zinc finger, CCHC-type containing protein [Tanacetum coccineum]|uniref:Zinc finger, CCHC-type containing protein n=1 Tax=Tanacetum coccineum TaxID=301880 RepID=A0ABQ4YEH2_9ASTR